MPELNQADLDFATTEQLFHDIAELTEIVEIIPKQDKNQKVAPTSLTLDEARALLFNGNLRGLQIRYDYQGYQWWDTLMAKQNGFRLVRIAHEF